MLSLFTSASRSVATARSVRVASGPMNHIARSIKTAESTQAKEDPEPQRSRQGDEEGIKTDDVAESESAFKSQSGSGPEEFVQEMDGKKGASAQVTPANGAASKPEGGMGSTGAHNG
ncbi:hypothetical protein [Phaffia rhodozyma]|uniref:Uncharacterized protein n=1 Tax=Phaffia rhodozyma TaxID=264483 RepID=A0A0F7STS6_PHARH|nr:hypothetical protein [Phaffia rhodozyma]